MSSPVPEKVGPYQIERRIGRGGMGEVYRGHDARLDRPVALKRIHPEPEVSASTRARFRREGRSLARVRHRAVVAVYDWIEGEGNGDDWLVMELLEGRSLQEEMKAGGLSLLRVSRIVREIAAGLAAAHAQGIVHRDLKPSNVMLASSELPDGRPGPDEQVKILDFGLAKRIVSMDGLTLTESISGEARLVGTAHYMSPEQASGRRVDQRSDLFGLGVIFYAMLAGESPFGGGDLLEVLTRICTATERPVHEVKPEVPTAVSSLVGHLLEKDPDLRPQSALEVVEVLDRLIEGLVARRSDAELIALLPASETAPEQPWLDEETRVKEPGIEASEQGAESPEPTPRPARRAPTLLRRRGLAAAAVLAAVVILAARSFGPRETAVPRQYVVVPETAWGEKPSAESEGGVADSAYELKRLAVQDGVVEALEGVEGIGVIEPHRRRSAEDPRDLTRVYGATAALTSELSCFPSHCQVLLKQIDATDGSTVWSRRFNDPTANLLSMRHLVSERVRQELTAFSPRGEQATYVRPEDYETWLGVVLQYRTQSVATEELLGTLAQVRESSPKFLEAYQYAASMLRQRFVVGRDPNDLEEATGLLEKALEVSDQNPLVHRQLALLSIEAGRLEEAERALEAVERLDPGDATYYAHRSMLLERQGHSDEALASMREAVERQGSSERWMDLAMMEYRQGNFEAARSAADAALARDPEDYGVLSRSAEIELAGGSLERAAELFEALVERARGESELTNLGVVYLLLERLDDAIRLFEEALELAPTSPYARLNLADALALRGDAEAAAEYYRQTLERIEADPDPDHLLTVGAQALAHLGRNEEAVGAVQRAIRLEPDNPQTQFEAAVVYVVVGERTSALLHARRALELGVERRWFDFPWFEPIWADL